MVQCGARLNYGGSFIYYSITFTVDVFTHVKFLGVIIDESLSWDYHIDYLKKKLLSSIVVIKRIKQFIPKSEYIEIYNALFTSHLSYCISSWVGVNKNKLKKYFQSKNVV